MNIGSINQNNTVMSLGKATTKPQKPEKTDEKSAENGLALALKPKFAQSREELIQNKIDDLREQLSALAEAEEIDEKTKDLMRKSINEQLSDLNVELMDVRKQRMEKEAEKAASGGADGSRRFDRYEPSEALKNMQKATDADTALEQAKMQKSVSGRLENKQNILKNELSADAKRGAATKQKEEELVDIKSKLRDARSKLSDKLEDADKEADGESYMTFNTGLLWIEEMRQKAIEQRNAESEAAEETALPAENDAIPDIRLASDEDAMPINGTISGVKLFTDEETERDFADLMRNWAARLSAEGSDETETAE